MAQIHARRVCHADLHYREGGITNEFRLGHEVAGDVEQVGQGVAEVAPGEYDLAGTLALVAVPSPEMTGEKIGLGNVEGALHRMERGEVLRSVVML